MDWYTDKNLLAKKILEKIAQSNELLSYTTLLDRAGQLGIEQNIFDAAIERLQKTKRVTVKVKGDEIYYKALEKPKPKAFDSHLQWLKENYPYPTPCSATDCHGLCVACMPFPEIDMSYLFMTPDEMKEYKAQMKGLPVHMLKHYKGHDYSSQ